MLNSLASFIGCALKRREEVMAVKLQERQVLGDRVIVLVSAEESSGALFRFEYVARAVTPSPRDHIHTQQEERVEVIEGTVRCRVAGVEYALRRGEKMTIAPGIPHAVWNDDPRGSRSIGEYRPAMNAQAMFRGYIEGVAARSQ
jgi:quercetin dioxygenase-like cupin family protein